MKHTWSVTLLLVVLFLAAQYLGLLVYSHYATADLPFGIERPELEPSTSVLLPLAAWLPGEIAFGLAVVLALLKIVQRSPVFHNLTELLIYGGLAAIFVPILSVFSMGILLALISIYDYI